MKYVSTRGAAAGSSFREALFSGYAVDGGLFMPEEVPRVSADTLRQWRALSYPQLVQNICSLYISPDEIPVQELGALIERALSRFAHSEVVTFKRLRDGLNVLELFHGPTMAFKDLAMCCLAQFILYFLQKEDKHVTIVVGTSGDTGGSAIASLRGAKRADVVVLLPAGRCSRVQELHMTTAMEENVHVFTVEGSSDDLDEPIRRLFADSEFSSRHGVISINSINWGRVLVQVAHHFYAYFRCTDGGGGGGGAEVEEEEMPTVEVVVPTGAAGNAAVAREQGHGGRAAGFAQRKSAGALGRDSSRTLPPGVTAGCVARRMGLPIRLLCAVNQNDVVHRALRSGDFSVDGAVKPSLASAIDIQVPYNMERVFHLCSDADTALVRDVMTRFYESGQANLPATLQSKMREALSSSALSDADISGAMQRCWQENAYLLCPHSAVAVALHYSRPTPPGAHRVCLATASPAKFQEVVERVGLRQPEHPEVAALRGLPQRSVPMRRGDDWDALLRNAVARISRRRASPAP
uniref:Threonine synthase-like 2 isoform X2 n=1 Tax=Petromyzon marinus TaxID=7757 RepID=A0AAJ7WQ96_PETMA|nr:threonine synthase-like 2 isoform X2 [Petromyzon marinus]